MLTINTNMPSVNALKNLNNTVKNLNNTFQRISSGLRINKAGDDAAGLGVAENLDMEYRGVRQAMRNANDGVSVVNIAEASANEVGNIIKRMRELAVQSSSGTLATTERSYIQTEFLELTSEIDRIADTTEFNGVKLANGVGTSVDVQVGVNNTANDRISITLGDLTAVAGLGIAATVSMSTAVKAQAALTVIDGAMNKVNGFRANFGAVQNRFESALRNLDTYSENILAGQSRIRDADFAYETAASAKNQILQQSGVAVLAQANQLNQAALRLVG
jgi:flagellin